MTDYKVKGIGRDMSRPQDMLFGETIQERKASAYVNYTNC